MNVRSSALCMKLTITPEFSSECVICIALGFFLSLLMLHKNILCITIMRKGPALSDSDIQMCSTIAQKRIQKPFQLRQRSLISALS
jgi:hypothetical protein